MKNAYLLVALFALACPTAKMPPTPAPNFFGRLRGLCDRAYYGKRTNEWSTVFSEDRKTFSYLLKRDGQLQFQTDFDLTKSLSQ